jgi:hypothetical protein
MHSLEDKILLSMKTNGKILVTVVERKGKPRVNEEDIAM